MTSDQSKRVLLAVDGSYQSFEAVRYASGILPSSHCEVVLFHIASRVPEAFWDLEKDPLWQQKVRMVRGWEEQQEKRIADFMDRSRQVLTNAGFSREAVKVEIRERRKGIARDIGKEARLGYDAVIVGRRGLSTVQDISLGGVASKTALKLIGTPVWLVGGKPEQSGIIIGMDSSEGSMKAVDHVAAMTRRRLPKVLLIHIIRSVSDGPDDLEEIFTEEYSKQHIEQASSQIREVFRKAVEKLTASGIPEDRISTRIITGVASRAASLLAEAARTAYGTIAVGRKGLSAVQEFDMGRVSGKLVQAARDLAVWLVD